MFYLIFYISLNIGKAIIKYAGDLIKWLKKKIPYASIATLRM